jgi:hypothetical protein
MRVRIGQPVDPESVSPEQLREHVIALRDDIALHDVNRYALAA